MAWTVAFALLGALLFSMVVAPVLASFFFRKGAREWRNPLVSFLTDRYRIAVRWAIRHRAVTLGLVGCEHGRRDLSGCRRRDRFRVPAPPGRGRTLGTRHPGAEHRTDAKASGW